jgi:hypothetical protein
MAGTKNSAPTPGELGAILGRFSDARAVIETAVQVMEGGDYPPEVVTARHGLKLLGAVYDELDRAIMRFDD